MDLPRLDSIDPKDKRVVVRGDLDVLKDGKIDETARLEALMPTLQWLIEKGAKNIFLIGHAGRPEGKVDETLTFKLLVRFFSEKLATEVEYVEHLPFDVYFELQEKILGSPKKLILLENLRFWPQEEANDKTFAEQLAYGQDFFVNDAFASSHREHASIVGIPSFVPGVAGLQFAKEVESLGKVKENPKKPVIAIISGLKKDKLDYLEDFKKFCDKILVAGRLPEFLGEVPDQKLLVAQLNPDKEDITIRSIEKFEAEIAGAGTIILAGPIGKYEETEHQLGTKRVFEAVARSSAFKIACGGDTIAALKILSGVEGFDFVSLAGGASLEFLAKGTISGIEALVAKREKV